MASFLRSRAVQLAIVLGIGSASVLFLVTRRAEPANSLTAAQAQQRGYRSKEQYDALNALSARVGQPGDFTAEQLALLQRTLREGGLTPNEADYTRQVEALIPFRDTASAAQMRQVVDIARPYAGSASLHTPLYELLFSFHHKPQGRALIKEISESSQDGLAPIAREVVQNKNAS